MNALARTHRSSLLRRNSSQLSCIRPTTACLRGRAQEQYWEFMGTSGTHSIIDVASVIPADFAGEEFGTIRLLSDGEYVELFGVAQPGRADYAPLVNSERLHEYVTGGRWTGRAAVLWADGAPAEIAFWGYSGD
jgi:hypothetical protein